MGHLLGIKHCIYAKCVMNGSNHLDEADDRPFALCPVDLKKLEATLVTARLDEPVSLLSREERILAWLEQHSLAGDAVLTRRRIATMRGEVIADAAAAVAITCEKRTTAGGSSELIASGGEEAEAGTRGARRLEIDGAAVAARKPSIEPGSAESINQTLLESQELLKSLESTWELFDRFDRAREKLRQAAAQMLERAA